MRYKNKVTGVELETDCEIAGGDWEAVQPSKPKPNRGKE